MSDRGKGCCKSKSREKPTSRPVPIANAGDPGVGTRRYTTRKSAQGLVKRGRAVWIEGGRAIFLVPQALIEAIEAREQKKLEEELVERDILRMRGGVLWWNGARNRPGKRYLPGQVRS